MHSSKVVAQRGASQAQAGSIKSSHSFRRYLHIEAVFVFEAGPEHWSAPSSGQAISDAHVREGQSDAEPHLHDLGLPRAWIRSSEGADAPRRLPNGQWVEQGRTGAPRVTNTRRELETKSKSASRVCQTASRYEPEARASPPTFSRFRER